MTFIYLGLYIAFLLGVWGFYAVARMHTMKFKNFSGHIQPVTNILGIFIAVLSIIGLIIIFNLDENSSTYEININSNNEKLEKKENTEKNSYQEDIIGDDYY